jgi:hypothetical protein
MAKKQKSFADKAAGSKEKEAVYVKYVKSVKSEKTGQWRFNEQMVRSKKGEQLDVALKRMDEVANLVDIDLSEFEIAEPPVEETVAEIADETVETENASAGDKADIAGDPVTEENASVDAPDLESSEEPIKEES